MIKKLPIIIALLALFLLPSLTRAQIDVSTLTVAPSRQELTLDPGETKTITIKFLNNGQELVSGPVRVVDFIVEDKEGSPIFLDETIKITGATQISRRFSAASWVSLPYQTISIAAKNKVIVDVKISAPADARPGGRYLAVYFEPGGFLPESGNQPREAGSPVVSRIVGLVYIRVSGPITEQANLVKFSAPRFSEYGPVLVTTEIANQGDYHIRPQGTITLFNSFGRQVAQDTFGEANIFPDASRLFENQLGQKWMFGRYKAKLMANFGESGKTLSGTIFFWVLPWKVILITLLAITIIILFFSTFYRRLKGRQEELEAKLAEEEKELDELKKKLAEKGE